MMDSPTTIAIGTLDISAEMSEGFKPTHTGGVQWVDLNCIDPNPWQPRIGEDNEHIKKLAESIATNNLLQIPSARRHPTHVGHYQLAFGHSRLAAFKFLRDATDKGARFETMPLNIVELSDRQMADAAAAENVARKDLSAIEMARGIKRYIDDFGATQIEAGRVFGYSSQSAVSNLLRLLQLPEPVQQQVNDGKLPERYARELITLSRASEKAAVEVATKYADAASKEDNDDGDVRNVFERALDGAYDRNGKSMREAAWQMAWPGKPIPVANPGPNQPSEVPACKGCPFFVDPGNEYYRRCLKPACFNLKTEMYAQHALEAASKKHGIPVLAKGEEGVPVWGVSRELLPLEVVKQAMKDKHATLRIGRFVLKKGEYDYNNHQRESLLGYSIIVLMTTDANALKKAYAAEKAKAKANREETQWEREQRLRRERDKRNEQIIKLAAPHMASAICVPSALLPALHEKAVGYMTNEARQQWAGKTDAERKVSIIEELLEQITDVHSYQKAPTENALIQKITDLAGDMNIRLPQGWYHEATAVPVNGKAKKGKK